MAKIQCPNFEDEKAQDIKWINKRDRIFARDFHQCAVCFSKRTLQVHLKQYHYIVRLDRFKEPWNYEDELLITLCKDCHRRGHMSFEIPIRYI